MSRESIAKVLKRLREQSGLTADQVGAMVGKSGKTVNAWENNRGQPDAEILMQLCSIYNVEDILAEFRDESSNAVDFLSQNTKTPDHEGQVSTIGNTIRLAGRDGSYVERRLSDEQMRAFKLMLQQMPDADDL